MMTYKELYENLVTAGLKDIEARIFAALLIKGKAGAGEIGRMIETSGQNVSMSIKGLVDKNLIIKNGRDYALASPSGFSNFLQKETNRAIEKIEFQKNTGITLASIVNEAYMQSTGKPVVQMLNYEQWQDFKENILTEGKEKTVFLIRGRRVKNMNKKILEKKTKTYEQIFKKGIKYKIITPFIDRSMDVDDQNAKYYSINSPAFKKFNIDITIKDDYMAINRRLKDNKDFEIIIIKSKEISESFIELFNFLEKNT